jgi:hypothetical protein
LEEYAKPEIKISDASGDNVYDISFQSPERHWDPEVKSCQAVEKR